MKKSLDPKRDRDSFRLWAGSITWGNNAPVKYQFGGALTGPWHDTMTANDKYRRDSIDGGTTWGEPYQFRGEDGKDGSNGSDASVPDWVRAYTRTATYIDSQWVIAPNIAGGTITALDKMEATCDFFVGNRIWLGRGSDTTSKEIRFNGTACISTPASPKDDSIKISCVELDLSDISGKIEWGKHAPVAVFG